MNIIKDLFHLSMQVDDYDKTLDFYCGKLGFGQMFELKVKDFKEMLHLTETDTNNDLKWLTYLRVAPEEYLEIFNGIVNPPDFELKRADKSKGSVIHSFALGCDDLSKTIRALEEKGIYMKNGYITDPTGFKIRLVEKKGHKAEKDRLFHSLAGVSLYVNDLAYMTDYLSGMGMEKVSETVSSVLFHLGENDQYIELIHKPETLATGDEDILGHIALQVNSIADAVWEWGNAGVRTCMQPMFRDQPFEVKKDVVGNFAVDGCEIVWAVSRDGYRFEIMRQPGNTLQQKWERENIF